MVVVLAILLPVANPASADIRVAAGSVHYTGPISDTLNQRLFEAVQGKDIRRLIITSAGGEVAAGISLGLWVYEHRLDIEVPAYCLSACANYVFPAGRHKSIGAGAIVAWHGNYHHLKQTGLWRDDIPSRMERHGEDAATALVQVQDEVERLAGLESDFYTRIGVDEYLCWIGKMPPYNVPNYYFLSEHDMARFGVTQVRIPPEYENTDVSGFGVHIMYLELRASEF